MSRSPGRDEVFLKLFLKTSPEAVTEEELNYFAEHPRRAGLIEHDKGRPRVVRYEHGKRAPYGRDGVNTTD